MNSVNEDKYWQFREMLEEGKLRTPQKETSSAKKFFARTLGWMRPGKDRHLTDDERKRKGFHTSLKQKRKNRLIETDPVQYAINQYETNKQNKRESNLQNQMKREQDAAISAQRAHELQLAKVSKPQTTNIIHTPTSTPAPNLPKYSDRAKSIVNRPFPYGKFVKGAAIGAGTVGLAYGGYKLYQKYKNRDRDKDYNESYDSDINDLVLNILND